MRGVYWLDRLHGAPIGGAVLRDPLTAIGVGTTVVGGLLGADAQRDAARANAAIAAQNAQLARERAEFEERRLRQDTERVLSAQRAAAGASGSALEGSALAIMMETAFESELDALFIRRTGIIEASRFAAQADAFEAAGDAAFVGGLLGGAGELAEGLGRAGRLASQGG